MANSKWWENGDPDDPISPKHQRFIHEFMKDLNGTQAAIRTGWSPKGAHVHASRLLRKPNIAKEIAKRMQKFAMSPSEIIERIGAMARGEIPTRRVVTVKGGVKDVREEYNTDSAIEKAGKLHALFADRHILEFDGLEILEIEEDAEN